MDPPPVLQPYWTPGDNNLFQIEKISLVGYQSRTYLGHNLSEIATYQNVFHPAVSPLHNWADQVMNGEPDCQCRWIH